MKTPRHTPPTRGRSRWGMLAFLLALAWMVSGCAITREAELKTTPPYQEQSVYSEALYRLGAMTEIYNTPWVKVQSTDILDDTGASAPLATGGEIQRNISEIMKTALNSIGGRVIFIEYDPVYVNNQIATGYSRFEKKLIPDVVITGGITGFDRGLATVSGNKDISADVTFPDIQNDDGNLPPTDMMAASYSDSVKKGMARISLDFNMKRFDTLAGIPRMCATNSMLVHKLVQERELAITLFGPTFGLRGSTTKVQGRHQAVRVLVQLSALQLLGRYLAVPYWRLLGDDAKADRVVRDQVDRSFDRMTEAQRLHNVQQWLYIWGYDVQVTDTVDDKTAAALRAFAGIPETTTPTVTKEIFRRLYLEMPLDSAAYARRMQVNRMLASQAAAKNG